VRLTYFFDAGLPAASAASLQIVNTLRALCERDVQVTVYTGRCRPDDVEGTLAY